MFYVFKKPIAILLSFVFVLSLTGCFENGETTSSAGDLSSVSSEDVSSEDTSSGQLPDNKLTDAEIIELLLNEEIMETTRNLAMKSTVKETVDSDGFKMTATVKIVLYSMEYEDDYEYYQESEMLGQTYIQCYRDGHYYWMQKKGDNNEGYSEEMTEGEFFEWHWSASKVLITASMLREATGVRESEKMTVTYEGVSETLGQTLLNSDEEVQGLLWENEGATLSITASSFEIVMENGVRKTNDLSATGEIVDEEGKVLATCTVVSANEYLDYGPDADFDIPMPDGLSELPDYEEYWAEQEDGDLIGL